MISSVTKPLVLASFVGALLLAQRAAAEVPPTITHQGRLFDTTGVPVSDTLEMTFAVYGTAAGGVAIWTETHSVAFDDGYYSVELGGITPFDSTVIDGSTRYMGVTIETDSEMTPRGTVGSVPYAMLANDVNGDINPNTVNIPGYGQVIDENGQWVGDNAGLVGPVGPAGPVGPVGPAGSVGPAGPMGATGAQGVAGPAGPAGATGATGAQGPVGPAGPMGATGAQGVAGPAGPAGATGSTGAQGPVGPAGPAGPVGATGAIGPIGPAGPAGATGATGALGPVGPAGPAGPVGATGATGVVATGSFGGYAGVSIAGAAVAYVFVGPTVSVTLAAGQRITGAGEAPLATAAGVASGYAGLCYQLNGAGVLTNFVGFNYSIVEWDTTRTPTAASASISGLAAGNYTVGFCVENTGAVALTDNDYVNGWVIVTNN